MKIKYQTKFGGYIPLLRAALYLITTKTLSFAQFGAYIAIISQADFDKRHANYGVIIRDDFEIAKALACDYTTIYNHRKTLIKKGLLAEKDGLTIVPNFFLYELEWVKQLSKVPAEFFQDFFVKPQNNIDQLQEIIEKTQQLLPQKPPQSSNVPFKSELSASSSNSDTNDELTEYFRETEIKENEDGL